MRNLSLEFRMPVDAVIVNPSTSFVAVDTSQLGAGEAQLVYLSTNGIPGRILSIQDQTGFLSSPQSILVSTTQGVSFTNGVSSVQITQPFSQITVSAASSSSWNLLNAYPVPLGSTATFKGVDTSNLTAQELIASQQVSTGEVIVRTSQFSTQVDVQGSLFQSTLTLGNAPLLNGQNLTIQGPTQIQGNLVTSALQTSGILSTASNCFVAGTISTMASASIEGNVTVAGQLSAPNASLPFQSLTVEASTIIQGALSTIGPIRLMNAVPIQVGGTLSTSVIAAQQGIAQSTATVGTALFQGNPGFLRVFAGLNIPSTQISSLSLQGTLQTSTFRGTFSTLQASTLQRITLSTGSLLNASGSISVSSFQTGSIQVNATPWTFPHTLQLEQLNVNQLLVGGDQTLSNSGNSASFSQFQTREFAGSSLSTTILRASTFRPSAEAVIGAVSTSSLNLSTISQVSMQSTSILSDRPSNTFSNASTHTQFLTLNSGTLSTSILQFLTSSLTFSNSITADTLLGSSTCSVSSLALSTPTLYQLGSNTLDFQKINFGTVSTIGDVSLSLQVSSVSSFAQSGLGTQASPLILSNVGPLTPAAQAGFINVWLSNPGGQVEPVGLNISANFTWSNDSSATSQIKIHPQTNPNSNYNGTTFLGSLGVDQTQGPQNDQFLDPTWNNVSTGNIRVDFNTAGIATSETQQLDGTQTGRQENLWVTTPPPLQQDPLTGGGRYGDSVIFSGDTNVFSLTTNALGLSSIAAGTWTVTAQIQILSGGDTTFQTKIQKTGDGSPFVQTTPVQLNQSESGVQKAITTASISSQSLSPSDVFLVQFWFNANNSTSVRFQTNTDLSGSVQDISSAAPIHEPFLRFQVDTTIPATSQQIDCVNAQLLTPTQPSTNSSFSANAEADRDVMIQTFQTGVGEPNETTIPAGTWTLKTQALQAGNLVSFYAKVQLNEETTPLFTTATWNLDGFLVLNEVPMTGVIASPISITTSDRLRIEYYLAAGGVGGSISLECRNTTFSGNIFRKNSPALGDNTVISIVGGYSSRVETTIGGGFAGSALVTLQAQVQKPVNPPPNLYFIQNQTFDMNLGAFSWPNALSSVVISNPQNDTATRDVQYQGAITITSDPRVKQFIHPADRSACASTFQHIPIQHQALKDPQMSTFRLEDKHRLGILADTIEPLFPESVQRVPTEFGPVSTLKMVDTHELKLHHLAATQHLMKQVELLEQTLSSVMARRGST